MSNNKSPMLTPRLANALFESIKSHSNELAGTGLTWFAVITAHQEQVEWWLKVTSYSCAILVSGLTAWSILKKNKQ